MGKQFFGVIRTLAKKAATIDQDKILKGILDDPLIQAQIVDLNTQKQLFDLGIDSEGNTLGDYSPATIHGTKNYPGKIEKGQPYDHITLKDTGEFYDSFKIKNEKEGFYITANGTKGKVSVEQHFNTNTQSVQGVKVGDTNLVEQFGKAILGLTRDSLNEIIPEIKQRYVEGLRAHLGL